MEKSPDAFRTISEVAEALETPAHVLRFWESRFPQIKPVKRAGGRRYYRPADVALLGGIRHLLHNDGMTIRGVQKVLREQGVRHVAAMAPGGDASVFDIDDEDLVLDLDVTEQLPLDPPETGQILAMEPVARRATLAPDMPADVVQLHAPAVPSLPEGPAERPEVFSEGFLLPTANRRPLPTLEPGPVTDDVPEAAHIWVEDSDVAEAPTFEPLFPLQAALRNLSDLGLADGDAMQAEAEPDLQTEAVTATFALEAEPVPADLAAVELLGSEFLGSEESPEIAAAQADAVPPNLAGIAARLRALPRPVLPDHAQRLAEVQMRLGLLHAQMAEAIRGRK